MLNIWGSDLDPQQEKAVTFSSQFPLEWPMPTSHLAKFGARLSW